MKYFLSCDWGTSSFRIRYVDAGTLTYQSAESTGKGIAKTFELWKKSERKEEERFSFYLAIIEDYIKALEQQLKFSIKKTPLIISGMAISAIGMVDIPYKQVPFMADGSDLESLKINATSGFDHDILMISGAKTNNDAMRGEETQLAGCVHHDNGERLFIFPGTHSKHVRVKNGRVTDIKTYMTGEFFELLSKRSILSVSVEEGNDIKSSKNSESFKKGVADSAGSNILHTGFLVRTNDLFSKLTKQENYYYLSGLLIGTELRELTGGVYKGITLVVNEVMKPFYIAALKIRGIQKIHDFFEVENADTALIKGQLAIWNSLNK